MAYILIDISNLCSSFSIYPQNSTVHGTPRCIGKTLEHPNSRDFVCKDREQKCETMGNLVCNHNIIKGMNSNDRSCYPSSSCTCACLLTFVLTSFYLPWALELLRNCVQTSMMKHTYYTIKQYFNKGCTCVCILVNLSQHDPHS